MIIDAGPLIDAERVNSRFFAALKAASERGEELHTTHPVLAQVLRQPERQANLMRSIKSFQLHALDDALPIGRLLASSKTSDVVDAHLAVLAQALGTFILTTDIDDLHALGARCEAY